MPPMSRARSRCSSASLTVLHRHQDGPPAAERAAYLKSLTAQGAARGTVLRRASYCLWVAPEVACWPSDHLFKQSEIVGLASAWAATLATRLAERRIVLLATRQELQDRQSMIDIDKRALVDRIRSFFRL
jgi:hypothetical protein